MRTKEEKTNQRMGWLITAIAALMIVFQLSMNFYLYNQIKDNKQLIENVIEHYGK